MCTCYIWWDAPSQHDLQEFSCQRHRVSQHLGKQEHCPQCHEKLDSLYLSTNLRVIPFDENTEETDTHIRTRSVTQSIVLNRHILPYEENRSPVITWKEYRNYTVNKQTLRWYQVHTVPSRNKVKIRSFFPWMRSLAYWPSWDSVRFQDPRLDDAMHNASPLLENSLMNLIAQRLPNLSLPSSLDHVSTFWNLFWLYRPTSLPDHDTTNPVDVLRAFTGYDASSLVAGSDETLKVQMCTAIGQCLYVLPDCNVQQFFHEDGYGIPSPYDMYCFLRQIQKTTSKQSKDIAQKLLDFWEEDPAHSLRTSFLNIVNTRKYTIPKDVAHYWIDPSRLPSLVRGIYDLPGKRRTPGFLRSLLQTKNPVLVHTYMRLEASHSPHYPTPF